jgi:hypothetical protein
MAFLGSFSRTRYLKKVAQAAAAMCFVTALGCSSPKESPPIVAADENAEASYLTPRYLGEAIDQLIGPLAKPVRMLSLTALNRVVVIQVQGAEDRNSVLEYRLSDGKVSGPVPVELKGPGKLPDNLFRVDSFDPHVAEKVLTAVRIEYSEEVRKLVVTRNLPASMDIQFRVFLKTGTKDRIVAADKGGRLLGPLTTAPSPPNVASPTPP